MIKVLVLKSGFSLWIIGGHVSDVHRYGGQIMTHFPSGDIEVRSPLFGRRWRSDLFRVGGRCSSVDTVRLTVVAGGNQRSDPGCCLADDSLAVAVV
jgi:hypothetical protein